MIYSVKQTVVSAFQESYHILISLFKILVPMIILIKILEMTGFVAILGMALSPVMYLVGLPGEMGLVWASALMTNIYGGIVVFVALAKGLDMTVAQVTVIASMMLMAHAIPVEVQIAKKAGTRFIAMTAFRVVSALIYGVILNIIYTATNTLTEPAKVLWSPPVRENTLIGWATGQAQNLLSIAVIVTLLVFLMKLLKVLGIINIINSACGPLLKVMGIGKDAAYVTMVGFTLGLTYGGGLIINEAKSGKLTHRDIFFGLAFMGICHSMIEDTLLMVSIGGHLSGLLWIRTIFSVLLTALVVRLSAMMSDRVFYRYLFLNQNA
ncbi:MAG: hypothetical protein AB7E96_01465 [Deferribacterales bacterium]